MMSASVSVIPFAVASLLASAAPDPAASAAVETAAATNGTLTVDALLREVRERAPALQSARATFGVTKADETNADVWPNPNASYGFSGTAFGADALNGQQHAIDVAVPLLIAGQGGARLEAARAATFAAEADLRGAAADLEHDTRAAFDDLLVAQARVDVAQKALDEVLEAEKIVDAHAESGTGSRYDALRISAAVAAAQGALGDEQQKLIDAQAKIAALVGRPDFKPKAVGDLVAGAMPSSPLQIERVWNVESAKRKIAAAQKLLEKAEREAWPVPSISAGTVLWPGAAPFPGVKSAGGAGGALMAGVSSDIPLFDRNQTAIAHARAAVTEAEAQQRQALLEAQAAYDAARTSAQRADELLRAFDERTGAGKIGDMRGMAREGYQSGKQSILDLVDALNAIVSTELQRIDLVGNARRTRLDLARASGALGDAILGDDAK